MSVEINIEFERECFKCEGRFRYMPNEPCDRCCSTGRVPTELGNELLEFLEHQGIKPAVSDHIDRRWVSLVHVHRMDCGPRNSPTIFRRHTWMN